MCFRNLFNSFQKPTVYPSPFVEPNFSAGLDFETTRLTEMTTLSYLSLELLLNIAITPERDYQVLPCAKDKQDLCSTAGTRKLLYDAPSSLYQHSLKDKLWFSSFIARQLTRAFDICRPRLNTSMTDDRVGMPNAAQ